MTEHVEQEGAESTPPAEAQTTEHMIPKTRFDQVNEERKRLADELAKRDAESKKLQEEQMTEQQKYKELAEARAAELEDMRKQADAASAVAKKAEREADIVAQAAALGFADPKDAVLLVGDAEDVAAALKGLAEKKPYLLESTKKVPPSLDANSTQGGAQETRAERRKRLLG